MALVGAHEQREAAIAVRQTDRYRCLALLVSSYRKCVESLGLFKAHCKHITRRAVEHVIGGRAQQQRQAMTAVAADDDQVAALFFEPVHEFPDVAGHKPGGHRQCSLQGTGP